MNREMRRHPPANGIHLLPQMAAQAQVPQPAGPVFNVGPLMNDVQLVAYLAAGRHGTPAEAVEWAVDVIAEAMARVESGDVGRRIQAAVQAAVLATKSSRPDAAG